MSPRRANRPRVAAASAVPEPLVAPRIPEALTTVTDWDEGDALGWAEVELRGDHIGVVAHRWEIVRSRLVDVRLTAGQFDGSRFTDVRFEGCDLSGASLMESAFTRVEFLRCRLSGATLGGARIRDVKLVDCKLDGAHLRMAKGDRFEMERCVATTADFSGAQMIGCHMRDCDLGGADFSNVQLPGLRLHGSSLDQLRGSTSLRGAIIDTAQVYPLALQLFDSIGIMVDDDRDPAPRS